MARRKNTNPIKALLTLVLIIIAAAFMLKYVWYVLAIIALALAIRIYLGLQRERRLHALRIADIDNMPGREFEYYVKRLLEAQGYRASVTPASGDLGADVIASKGDLKYAVQVKRYSTGVPRTAVSDAVASKDHYQCDQAMVVTNNYFTAGAKELARSTRCVLVDRDLLTDWILDFQASPQNSATGFSGKLAFQKVGLALFALLCVGFLIKGISSPAQSITLPTVRIPVSNITKPNSENNPPTQGNQASDVAIQSATNALNTSIDNLNSDISQAGQIDLNNDLQQFTSPLNTMQNDYAKFKADASVQPLHNYQYMTVRSDFSALQSDLNALRSCDIGLEGDLRPGQLLNAQIEDALGKVRVAWQAYQQVVPSGTAASNDPATTIQTAQNQQALIGTKAHSRTDTGNG